MDVYNPGNLLVSVKKRAESREITKIHDDAWVM